MKLIGEMILKISHSQGVFIAYILKSLTAAILILADGPKSIARWPKINSVRPLDNMNTNFKLEVDWGNSFDIAFTSKYNF